MIDKTKIAHSFSRAATTYDSVAYLQRYIGQQLLDQMGHVLLDKKAIQRCVDLGCGTGFFQDALQARFDSAQHIACDLAEGMLQYVQQQKKHVQLVCADAEVMPFKDNSVDLVFSNLALQWCENIDAVFAESYRILDKGGYFCLTTLGPKTLYELKQSWAKVDQHEHVNHFKTYQAWLDAAKHQSFSVEVAQRKEEVLLFESLKQLTQELKQLGAHNMNAGQAKSLTGRKRWQALQEAYQSFRDVDGYYPATYDVYYLIVKK